jgi:hypothetical protein
MSPDIIPADPRTWRDWRDPAAHGFVKVDCDTALERALSSGVTVVAIAGAILLWLAFGSPRSHVGPLPPLDSRTLPVAWSLLALAVVLFAARALTNSFYLVDPARHVIYSHFQFLFIRRVRLLLERKDILGVSTEARQRRTRYSSWWEQRVVLIGANGHVLPLGNWRRDALWVSNDAAQQLAKQIDCQWYEAPDNSQLLVKMKDGVASASFVPFTWLTSTDWFRWLAVLLALAIGGVAYALRGLP